MKLYLNFTLKCTMNFQQLNKHIDIHNLVNTIRHPPCISNIKFNIQLKYILN